MGDVAILTSVGAPSSCAAEWMTAALTKDMLDERDQLAPEAVRREAQRPPPARGRVDLAAPRLEACNRLGKAVGGLLLEPDAGRLAAAVQRHDGLGDAALAVGDYRRAAGHRLDGDDAEVLLAGEQ